MLSRRCKLIFPYRCAAIIETDRPNDLSYVAVGPGARESLLPLAVMTRESPLRYIETASRGPGIALPKRAKGPWSLSHGRMSVSLEYTIA